MAVLSAAEAAPRLQQEYRDGRLIPFLGAGYSKPLKLPDWSELVGWMAARLGFEPELFLLHGRYEQLAEYFQLAGHDHFQHLVYEMTRRFDSEEALEAPVDQRLRSDLLSHSFLFMGYSFNDLNIRYIWYRMHQLRLRGQEGARRPHARRCFFATFGAGPIQPEILEQWNIDVIQLDPADKEASVADLLERIRRAPGAP